MFWSGELIAQYAPVRRRAALPPSVSPWLGKATAAYLGLAIGDALGATVEFLTPNEIRHQIGVHRDITGGGWLRLKAGQVTDDTTMSLALEASRTCTRYCTAFTLTSSERQNASRSSNPGLSFFLSASGSAYRT